MILANYFVDISDISWCSYANLISMTTLAILNKYDAFNLYLYTQSGQGK